MAFLDEIFENAVHTTPNALIRTLCKKGLDFINTAGNSFVSCLGNAAKSNQVVLINIEMETAPQFYKLCREQHGSPHFPHIESIRKYDDFNVITMEKLIALDHLDIADDDKAYLEEHAPKVISYLRGEGTDAERARMETQYPQLKDAAVNILLVSQDVYVRSKGDTLPFCDIKPDNVFLRKTADGRKELVFGDPLYPGSGKNSDNVSFMESAYKRFNLPSLKNVMAKNPDLKFVM